MFGNLPFLWGYVNLLYRPVSGCRNFTSLPNIRHCFQICGEPLTLAIQANYPP
jgi:hypothetical protein